MVDFDDRLQFHVDTKVARKDVLRDLPAGSEPLTRKLWAGRAALEEWLAVDPEHAQLLLSDPEKALAAALPDLELPATLPGSELKKQVLNHVHLDRVELQLQQRDPTTADAVRVFGLLLDRVAAGTTTPAQIAADPEGAVQAAAAGGASADAVARVVIALRHVLGLPVQNLAMFDVLGPLPLAIEAFSSRLAPRRPR